VSLFLRQSLAGILIRRKGTGEIVILLNHFLNGRLIVNDKGGIRISFLQELIQQLIFTNLVSSQHWLFS